MIDHEPPPVDFARALTLALALLEEDREAVEAILAKSDRDLCLALTGALNAFAIETHGKEHAALLFSSMIFKRMAGAQ